MGTTPLRLFLQSICCNSPWNYAVFWKLQLQNQMVLKWEDGCCNIQRQRDSMESILGDLCLQGSNDLSSNCESITHDLNLSKYPIGLAVAEMSSVHYALGEGVVGEVAYTGNHRWIVSDDISACELFPKCPDKWLLQSVAGIKTILLVPVLPHGVLQLGSLCTVAEDLALVACLVDKFNLLSTTNQLIPSCMVQESFDKFEKYMPKILDSVIEHDSNVQSMGLIEVENPLGQSFHAKNEEMTEGNMFRLSCLEEELQAISYSDFYNLGGFADPVYETMKDYSDEGIMGQPNVKKDVNKAVHKHLNSFLSFPRHCELHKALGPTFLSHNNEHLWNSFIPREDACSNSSLVWNGDHIHTNEPRASESGGWCGKIYDAEHLLEAVVSNAGNGSEDKSSKSPKNTKSSTTSGKYVASSIAQGQSEGSAVVETVTIPWSRGTPAFVSRGRNATNNSHLSDCSFENMASTLIEEEHEKKGSGCLQLQKGSKQSNFSKRRARPGENKKPRPRDRQLIQDRVKELRELVPNGAKCSIDGLLDQTINHMLFLRSVTDQADRLRQWVHQEVRGQRNIKLPDIKSGRQNGTSWAYELGSEEKVCPIVVEDLEYPGHMLIEMLCNDHERFLEIAEAISRLELTILKGVIETRSENTWAHFIVEASRDFHRMDIFWPLMQLLQQNRAPISSKI